MTKKELLAKCKAENVRFVRLQFTELYGHLKNVQIMLNLEITKSKSSTRLKPSAKAATK